MPCDTRSVYIHGGQESPVTHMELNRQYHGKSADNMREESADALTQAGINKAKEGPGRQTMPQAPGQKSS